jgi:hypothetical protein
MADDARKKLQERFAKIGERALARIHEYRPDLRDKNLEETVKILKAEASLMRSAYHRKKRYPLLDE